MLPSGIGERLRDIRKNNGLTIRAVAAMLDVSEVYWGRLEREQEFLSIKMLAEFANLFKVSVDYILYGTQPQSEPIEQAEALICDMSSLNQTDLATIVDMLNVYYQHQQETLLRSDSRFQMLFAKRLKECREKAGYTLEKLSEKTGLQITHLNKIELGNIMPTINTLDKIISVLEIPLDRVLSDSVYSGRAVMIKDILDMFQKFNPEQKEIASKAIKAYVKEKEMTN